MNHYLITLPKDPPVVVAAERWFDVRQWARTQYPDHQSVEAVIGKPTAVHFEIRWTGRPPNQKMEVIDLRSEK